MKRFQVIIQGQTVKFRRTPYGRTIVSCSCNHLFCDHRFKALPEWSRFIRRES